MNKLFLIVLLLWASNAQALDKISSLLDSSKIHAHYKINACHNGKSISLVIREILSRQGICSDREQVVSAFKAMVKADDNALFLRKSFTLCCDEKTNSCIVQEGPHNELSPLAKLLPIVIATATLVWKNRTSLRYKANKIRKKMAMYGTRSKPEVITLPLA